MKTKKRYMTAGLLLMVVAQLLPGCWVVGKRDIFEYQRLEKKATEEFIPYLYIKKNALRFSLLLVSFESEKLPHSLVMLQYDQTYLNTDEGFVSFVLDNLQIRFDDETVVECIDPKSPLSERSFDISKTKHGKYERHIFEGVIRKQMNFMVLTAGAAIKQDGTQVPFERVTKYEYVGRRSTLHTNLID